MKKFILAIGMVLCAVMLSACSEKDVQDYVENVTDAENKYVLGVKNGTPASIPGITYGEAFESFFSLPTWRHFKADSGEEVVEFTGKCTYHDAEVKARLQFIISDDGEHFEQGALSFNDVPQSDLITTAVIYKAFSTYADSHDISIEDEEEGMFEEETETGGWDESENDGLDDSSWSDDDSDVLDDGSWSDNADDVLDDEYYDETVYEYIFPESDSRYLKKAELKNCSAEELRLGRNEIYARYGRRFQDLELQDYFEATSWYIGYIDPEDFDESILNKYEKKNLKLIKQYENR